MITWHCRVVGNGPRLVEVLLLLRWLLLELLWRLSELLLLWWLSFELRLLLRLLAERLLLWRGLSLAWRGASCRSPSAENRVSNV